jgi:GxxExxY protein
MAINTLLQANITDKIIGSFFAVYNELGFGFLESVYANAMLVELSRRKALVKREVPVEVYFEGDPIGTFRLDMLVDEIVLVEVKSTELLSGAAERQSSTICARPKSRWRCFCTLVRSPGIGASSTPTRTNDSIGWIRVNSACSACSVIDDRS